MRLIAALVCLAFLLAIVLAAPAGAETVWPAAGLEVASGAGYQEGPVVIPDERGGSIIIWRDDSPGAMVLYAQRYDRQGQALWTAGGVPLSINLPVKDQLFPTAVPDGYGGCLVFWQDQRGTDSQIYGQHLTIVGTRGWGDEAMQMAPNPADQTGPAAASDGAGGAVVAWRDWRSVSSGGDVDLYAARVNTAGTLVYSATTVSIATTVEGYPRVAGDGAGGAFVAWATDQPNGADNNVHAQFLSPSGVKVWGTHGTGVCIAAEYQGSVALAPDGAGGLWVAWEDYRGTDSAVYFQRVNSSGGTVLASGGERLSGSSLEAIVPAMTPDGKGGVYVTYTANDTVDIGLYYQHVIPGVARLDNTDQPIYTGAGFSWDSPAELVPDGRNGCFVAWPDRRTGTWRMYAQQLTYRGETGFPAGGVALSNVDQYQSYPSLAATGTGRAVCAWTDGRNSGSGNLSDVYAQSLVVPVAGQGALSLLLEP